MFTIQDLNRVRNNSTNFKSILDAVMFTAEKNELAYDLNSHNSYVRGTYTELLLQDRLRQHGFDVLHCGDSRDYDLLIDNDVRAEVKLATLQHRGKSNSNMVRYLFHKIKPECFDIIFLVFLNPYGITVKWTDSEMFTEWSKEGYSRGKHGYQIYFDANMRSAKLAYNETLDGFVSLYKKKKIFSQLVGSSILESSATVKELV